MTIPIQFRCVLKFSAPLFCFIGTYHHGSLSNLSRYCFFSYLDQVILTNAFSGLKIENINFYHYKSTLLCSDINFCFSTISIDNLSNVFFSARIIQLYDLRRQLFGKLRLKFFYGCNGSQGFRCSLTLLD